MNIFYHIKDHLRLREAIKQADKAYQENNQRFYVMPVNNGQLIVLNRDNFRILKRKRYIPQKTNMQDVVRECFYCTPYSNGKEPMPPFVRKIRAAMYYQWCQKNRKAKKEAKSKAKKG